DVALVGVRLRTKDRATAAEVRRASRALAGTTGALLPVGLSIAAADLGARLSVGVALAAVDELGGHDLMQQSRIYGRPKHVRVELVLADDFAVHIIDFRGYSGYPLRGGHLRLLRP